MNSISNLNYRNQNQMASFIYFQIYIERYKFKNAQMSELWQTFKEVRHVLYPYQKFKRATG